MKIKLFLSIGAIILFWGIFALGALDLQLINEITMTPSSPAPGDTVTFTVSFKTFGGAVDNLKIIGGVDGANIFTRTYTHIDADKQRTDTFSWIATAGSHTIWFELDPDHTSGDSDYSNNRIETTIAVSAPPPPPLPNLTVTGCIVEPSTYKSGDKVLFKFNIKNIGNAPVPSKSYVDILFNGTLHDQWDDFPALPAGAVVPCGFRYTVKFPSTITIKVDSTNLITESNENDNSCGKAFKININRLRKSSTSVYKP